MSEEKSVQKAKKEGFFRSVVSEMKLVSWPSKKELRKDTLVVIETTILYAIFLAAADFVVGGAIKLFITGK